MSRPLNIDLYNQIKDAVYQQYPKHSAYRSMMIVKKYKDAGGTYEENKEMSKMNTKKWIKQQWTDANEYYRTNKIIPCGSQDTQKLYNEYPLCRPLSILQRLSKTQLKELIDEKNKLGKKPLITSRVLNTDVFNIKPTVSGSAVNIDFINQLNKIGLNPNIYLETARKRAAVNGYNRNNLFISDKKPHKLMIIDDDNKKRYFGRVGYNDFIIYSHLEDNNEVVVGYADKIRNRYIKSHSKIAGKWAEDKFSPNMLSLLINW
jgi:hypothetical protein